MPTKPIDWTVPGILGGLAAILLLMAAVGIGIDRILTARVDRIEAWPTTEALVVVNEVHLVSWYNEHTKKSEKRPKLTLEYTYEVAGRSYTGKNVNVDGTGGKFVDTDYPVGSRLPIRYDPADPSIAGAKIDLSEMKGNGFIYASSGVTALGLLLAFFATRSLLRQRAAIQGP